MFGAGFDPQVRYIRDGTSCTGIQTLQDALHANEGYSMEAAAEQVLKPEDNVDRHGNVALNEVAGWTDALFLGISAEKRGDGARRTSFAIG